MENENAILNTVEVADNEVTTTSLDKGKIVKTSVIALGAAVVIAGIVIAIKNRGKIKEAIARKKQEQNDYSDDESVDLGF